MDTTHRVSAETHILFAPTKPVVTARSGILYGSRIRLRALTIRVTALTQPNGSVGISTHLTAEPEEFVYNPDGHTGADLRLLVLEADQIPPQCMSEWDVLVGTVHALHPSLSYADSPLSQRSEARLAGAAVPA